MTFVIKTDKHIVAYLSNEMLQSNKNEILMHTTKEMPLPGTMFRKRNQT